MRAFENTGNGMGPDKEGHEPRRVVSLKIAPRELAFDIDGVLADTFHVFVKIAREEYDIQVNYDDITEYDFRKVVDIDEEICNVIIQRILNDPVHMGIKPMNGAVDVITRLSRYGTILFVTARPGRTSIYEWLVRHLKRVDPRLIRLEATGSHEDKIPILLEQGIRYFVEDRLDTCYLLATASVTPIVYEQPWNRICHPFRTVCSWEEISGMIQWSDQRP